MVSVLRVAAIVMCGVPVGASGEDGGRPGYKSLRYDENYEFLRTSSAAGDRWDWLKFMSADPSGWPYVSFGGEAREMVEAYRNEFFDTSADADSVYLLQRYLLHMDLHVDRRFRLFTQFQSSFENGKPGNSDVNMLDLHQLFADFVIGPDEDASLLVRAGRQELSFGSERLVGVREGTNNRRAFDAARIIAGNGDFQLSAFAGSPVEWDQGSFDDQNTRGAWLWGLYGTAPLAAVPGAKVDVYYLGNRRPGASFSQGTAEEKRHTVGSRFSGGRNGWDFNHEVIYQFGDFGGDTIRAWSIATDHGHTFDSLWLSPRLGLKAAVASGDSDPGDGRLGTFNPLYPRGNYFTEAALLGPSNFMDVRPGISIQPAEDITIEAGMDFYWRQSTRDGVYRPGGSMIYQGDENGERFVGTDFSLSGEWRATSHLTMSAAYTHFFAGGFVRDAGGADVDYGSIWITCRF